VKRLSDIASRITRKNDGAGHPVMTISAKNGFMLQSEKYSRDMAGQSAERYTLLRKGEFAYNKGNSQTSPQGCIFKLDKESAVVPFVYYCFSLKNNIDEKFAAQAFQNGILNRDLARAINSGVRNDGLLNLPVDDFFRCQIALPGIAEQRAISEVLDAMEEAITKTEALCRQLHEATEALAEALFLGIEPQTGLKVTSGWRASSLGAEMASIQVGIVIKPASYYVNDCGVPALRSLNVRPNRLNFADLVQISHDGHKLNAKSALRAGDVVTVRTGEPGKTAYIPDGIGELNCIDIIFSRPGPKIRGEYVSFFMNSRVAKRQIAVLQGGLAQQHLNVGEMKRIQISIPPLADQDRTVRVLNNMWASIEAEEARLEQLRSLRSALAQELLSGRLRLPEGMSAKHREKPERAA
jgi:hypothetical protein